jgi:copper chaperone CopZ
MDERSRERGGIPLLVAAAVCWWIPLFMILAALTIEGLASSPARLRTWVSAAAALILGVGFLLVYARRPAPGSFVGLRRFNIAMLWVVTAGVAAFAFVPGGNDGREASGVAPASPGASKAPLAPTATTKLEVEGMVSRSGAEAVREALLGVPGVLAVDVDVESGSAVVSSAPGSTPDSALVEAVVEAGYGAWPSRDGEHVEKKEIRDGDD